MQVQIGDDKRRVTALLAVPGGRGGAGSSVGCNLARSQGYIVHPSNSALPPGAVVAVGSGVGTVRPNDHEI